MGVLLLLLLTIASAEIRVPFSLSYKRVYLPVPSPAHDKITKAILPLPTAIPNYQYNYAVQDPHSGDDKAQQEWRKGDVVKGRYYVVDPDGTKRIVEYYADPVSGFNAVVRREPVIPSLPHVYQV